jgi:hypothetical protein
MTLRILWIGCWPLSGSRSARISNSSYEFKTVFTFAFLTVAQKGKVCKSYNSVLGEHFRAFYDIPSNAITYTAKDMREPPLFSWHLDDEDAPASSTFSTPSIRVKSPSSASLSVKSMQDPTVLGDHQFAESSPNLRGPDSLRSAPSTVGLTEEETISGAHSRVVFLVSLG